MTRVEGSEGADDILLGFAAVVIEVCSEGSTSLLGVWTVVVA